MQQRTNKERCKSRQKCMNEIDHHASYYSTIGFSFLQLILWPVTCDLYGITDSQYIKGLPRKARLIMRVGLQASR